MRRESEPSSRRTPDPFHDPGVFLPPRTVEVDGEPRPVASLLRRGAALAVDLCFAVFGAALALDAISFLVPLDTERAVPSILAVAGGLAVYVVWLRDRGASRPGGGLRYGLSLGRRLLRLALVPVAGPRRLARPVTVVEAAGGADTMRTLRAVLLGVASSLAALALLGHAVSRTTVFLEVRSYSDQARPFAAERGGTPRLAAIPSSLLVGRSRAWVRVDAQWEGEGAGAGSGDPIEFFLERAKGRWQVVEARIGEPAFLRKYALSAPDSDIPTP